MIPGLLWMIVANVATILGSLALLRRVRTGQPALDVALFMLCRILIVSSAVLVGGCTGFLKPAALGGAGAAALALLFLAREHRGWRLPRLLDLDRIAIGAALAVLLRLLLQVWFQAPMLGDPLAYHLPKVAEWVQAGGFTREMGVHPHVPFPAGFELIETWWVVFLKHDVLIEMAGLEFLILAGASTCALARWGGLDDRWACFAGLLYVLVPGLHFSATSCLNDAPAAAIIVALMSLAAARVPLPLLALAAGLGLGIKPTVGFALPGVALLMWGVRREPGAVRLPLPLALALPTAGLVVGASWYLRNAVWFGNPFHPLGTPGFSDPTPVQFGPRLGSLFQNLANLVNVRIYDQASRYGPNVDHMSGWGGAAFACGLVGLILALREETRIRRLAAAFGASLIGVLALVQDDPWCLKYVFFFPALLCIAAARLARALPGVRPFAWGALAFAFVGTTFGYDFRREDARVLAAQSWRLRSAAALSYGEIGSDVPSDAVGYFGSPTGAAYLLYRPDFSRRVAYLRSTTADRLKSDMESARVETLFCPSPTPEQRKILEEAQQRGLLRVETGRFFRSEGPSR